MGDIFIYLMIAAGVMIAYYIVDKNTPAALLVGAVGVVVGVVFYVAAMMWAATGFEIWNGQITAKERVYDPTTESYSCGTDSKGNTKTCSRTVPRWRWDIDSNVGNWSEHTYSLNDVPEIYARANIGDPFADTHMFRNFQYVSEQTVLINKQDVYDGWLPDYPSIYNGYMVHHALSDYVNTSNLDAMLAWAHKTWGPKYGVNVIVNIVSANAEGFSEALRNKWVGGKKNDAVITIYLDADKNVKNVEVFSRSTGSKVNAMQANFNIAMVDAVSEVKTYDFEAIVNAIEKALPLFERENLEQYDYLMTDYSAPWWVTLIGSILVFAACFGTATKLGGRGINAFMFTRQKRHTRHRYR